MKHARKQSPRNDTHFGEAKGDIDTTTENETISQLTCNHCGGMLKSTPEGTSCFMCGRDRSHRCENCLNGGKEGVAA